MSSEQQSGQTDPGISEEIEMLRHIIRRVYQLALEEVSLEKLEYAAQTLSTAINRLSGLVKPQLQLGASDRDELIASFNARWRLYRRS